MTDQEDDFSFFKGKTITLMGLGLLGRGVGDAAFLASHCKKLYVTDNKSHQELQASVEKLKEYANIEFHLGGHPEYLFTSVDFVIKGAGVKLDNPFIRIARQASVPVYMSTALFAFLAKIKTIGITGTRGKSTTTYMVSEILEKAGVKVLVGGNVRGVSTLAHLADIAKYDVCALELDSWQLQGFDDLGLSPSISVFTTFYPDHMNYYDGDMARYLYDKSSIFRHQKPGDVLITTSDVTTQIGKERFNHHGTWIIADSLPEDVHLQIPGPHNRLNATLAWTAAKAYGINERIIHDALRQFHGVEGRLQSVGAWQGRHFYNDSNATTQEATLAALTSFPSDQIVLIFGGSDKGLPLETLLDYITKNKIRAVLLRGTGSERVLEKIPTLPLTNSMPEAVKLAVSLSQEKDNIILSPAFASFGVFKNEYDRSDQFLHEIRLLMSTQA